MRERSWQIENQEVEMSNLLRNLRSFQLIGLWDISLLYFYDFYRYFYLILLTDTVVFELQTMMYTLYHHFIQKVKEEEVRKYNQKHRAYLIRAGKLDEREMESEMKGRGRAFENQNQNFGNRGRQERQERQETPVEKQVEPVRSNVEAKPKRQREFNRGGQRSAQPNQQTIQRPQQAFVKRQQIQPQSRPQRAQPVEQRRPVTAQIDRPIKQNKLTPEQLQYLNQSTLNQTQASKSPVPQPKRPQSQPKPQQKPIPALKPQKSQELSQFQEIKLVECGICGRKFKQQALMKHQGICQKVFQQKRKPFEVKVIDQEAQLLKNKSGKSKEPQGKAEKKEAQPKWKNQSEILRNFLKKGRGEKVQNQIVEEDTRILCPGCGRKFNDKAAVKHIQFCTNKPKKPKKN